MEKRKQSAEHLREMRSKILTAAKGLFLKQGYKKTTIRQIVERSGVLTGSIYHFFHNKEDLFQALVMALLQECADIIDERFPDENPVFKYAVMMLTELKSVECNAWILEAYYEGYGSKVIFERMVEHLTDVSARMFADSGLGYSHEDYYLRTLLIKGAMRSCVAEFYFVRPVDFQASWHMLMRMILPMYGADEAEVSSIIQRLEEIDPVIDDICRIIIERTRVL